MMRSVPPQQSGGRRRWLALAGGVLAAVLLVALVGVLRSEEAPGEASPPGLTPPRESAAEPVRGEPVVWRSRPVSATLEGLVTAAPRPSPSPSLPGGEEELPPLESATVTLFRMGSMQPVSVTSVDRDGRFRFPGLESGEYRVVAEAPEYVSETRTYRVEAGATGALRFSLAPVAPLNGVVVDSEGRLVSGAAVRLFPLVAPGSQVGPETPSAVLPVTETMSGSDGSFGLFGAQERDYLLEVAHPRFRTSVEPVRVSGSDVRVMLRRGVVVVGRVEDARGAPVPEAQVWLWEREVPGRGHAPSKSKETRADARGEFRLEGVDDGRYDVAARVEGRTGQTRGPLEVVEQRTPPGVVVVIEGALSITGTVVDASGAPVAGATVSATSSPSSPLEARLLEDESDRRMARTASDGTFTLSWLKDRPHALDAMDSEGARGRLDSVPAGSQGVRLQLVARGVLTGRVVSASRAPLASFSIDGTAFESASGRFSVPIRPEATQRLLVSAPGHLDRVVSVRIADGRDQDVGDIPLSEVYTLTGTVRDALSRAPLEGARVVGLPLGAEPGTPPAPPALSGPEGTFRLTGVDAERLALRVHRPGYREATLTVPRDSGPLVIELVPDTNRSGSQSE
ncbi:carboxypeptidase-like regulatory domain-containing protein [Archangium sp.]|uniref:carboxypeptidase-like regulatory domain-containing protein n=1 Tax=Archangium sp. TaxID=1872627 RepID=UPI00286BA369|nr:carboxypeptidase-like regulatory domain-containing protein [Archangium sp.]